MYENRLANSQAAAETVRVEVYGMLISKVAVNGFPSPTIILSRFFPRSTTALLHVPAKRSFKFVVAGWSITAWVYLSDPMFLGETF